MANIKSDTVTSLDSTNPSKVMVESSILKGRERVAGFRVATGTTPPAVGEKVDLVDLPAGARVWGIYLASDALSSGAGVAGMSIGDDSDVDRFVTALNLDTAFDGWVALRHEAADLTSAVFGIGFKYTNPTRVRGTVTGEALAASASLTGFVLYSVD